MKGIMNAFTPLIYACTKKGMNVQETQETLRVKGFKKVSVQSIYACRGNIRQGLIIGSVVRDIKKNSPLAAGALHKSKFQGILTNAPMQYTTQKKARMEAHKALEKTLGKASRMEAKAYRQYSVVINSLRNS